MTALDENREVAGTPGDDTRRAGAEAATEGATEGGANLAPDAFFVPDLIQLEVGRGHRVVVRPPLRIGRSGRFRDDVRTGTQALAGALEELIRAAPTQWHLMQPNWPSDPR